MRSGVSRTRYCDKGALNGGKSLAANFISFDHGGKLSGAIAPHQSSNSRVDADSNQGQQGNPIFWFAEIAALVGMAAIGFAYGLPRRNELGFVLTLGACFCTAFSTFIGLGHSRLPLLRSPSFFSCSNVSATCYRCAEDAYVFPLVVTELKFRDIRRHVFGTDDAGESRLRQTPRRLARGTTSTSSPTTRSTRTPSAAICGRA